MINFSYISFWFHFKCYALDPYLYVYHFRLFIVLRFGWPLLLKTAVWMIKHMFSCLFLDLIKFLFFYSRGIIKHVVWLISLWKLICWFLNLIGKSQITSSWILLLSSIDSGIKRAVTCRHSWIIISADLTSTKEQNRWHGSGWLYYGKDMKPVNGRLILRRLRFGAQVKLPR